MVVSFQLMITFGIFCSSVLGAIYNTPSEEFATEWGWRIMFLTAALPAIVQFAMFFMLPESPRWLVNQQRNDDARKVVTRMYADKDEVWREYEMEEMIEQQQLLELELEQQRLRHGGSNSWTFIMIMKTPHVRRALALGCGIQMFQQLGGINTLMYYTATIIKLSGITSDAASPNDAVWYSCIVSGTNFVFTFVPIFLVERMGRRMLLLLSDIGIILSLLFLGGAFLVINMTSATIKHNTEADAKPLLNTYSNLTDEINHCIYKSNCDNCVTLEQCGFCYKKVYEEEGNNATSYGWVFMYEGGTTSTISINYTTVVKMCLPVAVDHTGRTLVGQCDNETSLKQKDYPYEYTYDVCKSSDDGFLVLIAMLLYLVMFSIGFGPMAWVINAEIYPTWARSTGVALATATNWLFNFIISETFLSVTEALTKYGAFFLYAGISMVGFVLFYFTLPETKGLEMERIEDLFRTKKELAGAKQRRMTHRLSTISHGSPQSRRPTATAPLPTIKVDDDSDMETIKL